MMEHVRILLLLELSDNDLLCVNHVVYPFATYAHVCCFCVLAVVGDDCVRRWQC